MSGSTQHRRNLRQWTLDRFGNGFTAPCRGCGEELTQETLTLDRYPAPGSMGGTYRRGNVRPMCVGCNTSHVDEPGYPATETWGRSLRQRPFADLGALNASIRSPLDLQQERDRQ